MPLFRPPTFTQLTDQIAVSQLGNGTYSPSGVQYFTASVDFNSANTDTAFAIANLLPTGFTKYLVTACRICNASASLTTATCGLFTAAAAGGTALVSSGSAITVSTASADTNNNAQSLSLGSANTLCLSVATVPSIYFRVQNPQGSAATATVQVAIAPIP